MQTTNKITARKDRKKEDTHMRAIVCHTYGSPDVLELQEVAKPVPKEHEILIHVHDGSNAIRHRLSKG